jgi:hypothetical protein
MNWRDYLTDTERQRLVELKAETRVLKAEHRRIYDRCRKRMGKGTDA